MALVRNAEGGALEKIRTRDPWIFRTRATCDLRGLCPSRPNRDHGFDGSETSGGRHLRTLRAQRHLWPSSYFVSRPNRDHGCDGSETSGGRHLRPQRVQCHLWRSTHFVSGLTAITISTDRRRPRSALRDPRQVPRPTLHTCAFAEDGTAQRPMARSHSDLRLTRSAGSPRALAHPDPPRRRRAFARAPRSRRRPSARRSWSRSARPPS